MDSDKILHHIKKLLQHVEEYATAIAHDGSEEDIHQLRISYKKLRAFLRLSMCSQHPERSLKEMHPLKKVYSLAGEVRGMQLYSAKITALVSNEDYTGWLTAGTGKKKSKLSKDAGKLSLGHVAEKAAGHSFTHIDDKAVFGFIKQRRKTITALLQAGMTDDDLHEVRKQIKDILYTIDLLKSAPDKCFPISGKTNAEELKGLGDMLNDHQDYVMNLGLLHQRPRKFQHDGALLSLTNIWLEEKTALRSRILAAAGVK